MIESLTDAQGLYALAGLVFIVYVAGGVFYRLYLSPLAKFPGPKLAAATLWYEFYYDNIRRGQYTFKIIELHKKYGQQEPGPIIRISPYELHIDEPDYYEVLYSQHSPRDKSYYYTKQFDLDLSAFGTEKHDLHRRRRAVLNPYFSKQRIQRLEPVIHAEVNKFCQRIQDFANAGQPAPLTHGYTCLTTDIITEYTATKGFGYLDAPDWLPHWSRTLKSTGRIGTMAKQFPWILPFMKSFPQSLVTAMDPGMGLFFKLVKSCDEQIASIIKNREECKDLISQKMSTQPTLFTEILDSKLPPEEKSTKRLAQEFHVVIGAGTETTSNTLSVITYHLLKNPDKLKRLLDEIQKLEPNGTAQLSLPELEQLPYLSSVILEGLRLSYGVCTRLQRISPHQPLQFQNYTIPPGTPVGMTSVLMHHNESIFPDSWNFVPERWLDLTERKRLEKYMVAFTKGSRQCLGMHLARAEMFITIPTIFRRFKFELFNTTDDDIYIKHDFFVPAPKNQNSEGVRVFVNKRAE
ncbi:hypothetical protein FQN50_003883 [Emmonsiellopsis sp. PD_5]|nr:hypothetical protein FQN50_003883 [Emmonsiellopsis sp. PD_5]